MKDGLRCHSTANTATTKNNVLYAPTNAELLKIFRNVVIGLLVSELLLSPLLLPPLALALVGADGDAIYGVTALKWRINCAPDASVTCIVMSYECIALY